MPKLLDIVMTNRMPSAQHFYVFQQPAVFATDAPVMATCLFSSELGSLFDTGAVLVCQIQAQIYLSMQVGKPGSGGPSFSRRMLSADAGSNPNNAVEVNILPMGLKMPYHDPSVLPGCFRILLPDASTPDIGLPDISPDQALFIGQGQGIDPFGSPILSSFVMAQGMRQIECKPSQRFYVRAGGPRRMPGDVIDFDAEVGAAAECDFSAGARSARVDLEPDGRWTTRME
ncbi:hypothetical protein [Rhizobium sp. AAP43]|uniref:hypothetical protein n=1 Tax=Rhizobium sp. AAP43 TaxID=1523420 RepID=UPI0006B8FFB2|nr:hypothetical protein [Rhizobium sp. AAP43]KPF42250.1 hypothetical protein IP76_17725 [Rhizobium sp. AAP43]